jgi:hypothetical protein
MEMLAKQISVFLENKSGRLAEVTSILYENNINIRALSLADTNDFGVLRLIVSDSEKAQATLKTNGFTVSTLDVVFVEVTDQPGGLHKILAFLQQEAINVEYMYAFSQKTGDSAVIIFKFDDPDRAVKILEEKGVELFNTEFLNDLT